MKEPESFPYEHRASGMLFQIYRAPLIKKKKDGTTKEYRSYLVCHQVGAKPVQARRSSWKKIEAYIEDVVAAVRASDTERLELTGRDRRIYLAAVEVATKVGTEVDEAVREFVAISDILKPFQITPRDGALVLASTLARLKKLATTLPAVFDFFEKHKQLRVKNVPDVVEELTGELTKNHRGDYHIRNTSSRLNRFAKRFTGPISELEERDISAWLQALVKLVWKNGERVPNSKGELVSNRTRNNYRDAICQLFNFARTRGYVLKDVPTEASATVRLQVVSGKNHIISPSEGSKGIEALSPHLVPFAVLKLFNGIRTEEGYALSWEEIRTKVETLVVEAEISKLGQRRAPPLQPNAMSWLKPFAELTGRVNPRYSSSQSLYKAVRREFKKAGVELKRNTFRNCYISYRYAQPTESGIVADEAGTSKRMVEKNYKALATKEEARLWFSIEPSEQKLEQLRKYVVELKSQSTKGNS